MATMVESEVDSLSTALLNSIQHSTSLAYFSLLAANIIHKSLFLSPKDIHNGLLDILAVVCFFVGASIFSLFYLLDRSGHLEFVGYIVLIWTSAIPFIYFQYYHEQYLLAFLLSTICFGGARYLAAVYYGGAEAFRKYGIRFAFLALTPAIIACGRITICRYPMSMVFIKYAVFNGLGVLFYLVQVPERLFLMSGVSNVVLHSCILGSAAAFSISLIAAYDSPNHQHGMNCAWWG